jgi:hypothetical protein
MAAEIEEPAETLGALQPLKSALPFVAGQFPEHMENTVEAAKAEMHGHMTNAIQRAGLDAIACGALPFKLSIRKRSNGDVFAFYGQTAAQGSNP